MATFIFKKPFDIDDMRLKFIDGEAQGGINVSEMTEEEIQEKAREVSEARRQLLIAQNKKVKPHGG